MEAKMFLNSTKSLKQAVKYAAKRRGTVLTHVNGIHVMAGQFYERNGYYYNNENCILPDNLWEVMDAKEMKLRLKGGTK